MVALMIQGMHTWAFDSISRVASRTRPTHCPYARCCYIKTNDPFKAGDYRATVDIFLTEVPCPSCVKRKRWVCMQITLTVHSSQFLIWCLCLLWLPTYMHSSIVLGSHIVYCHQSSMWKSPQSYAIKYLHTDTFRTLAVHHYRICIKVQHPIQRAGASILTCTYLHLRINNRPCLQVVHRSKGHWNVVWWC